MPTCPACYHEMRFQTMSVDYCNIVVDLTAWHCLYCRDYLVGPAQTKQLQAAYEADLESAIHRSYDEGWQDGWHDKTEKEEIPIEDDGCVDENGEDT